MKASIKCMVFASLFLIVLSCSSVKVVANNHGVDPGIDDCHTTNSWSYFWGLKTKDVDVQPDITNVDYCICREGQLSWVETKTTFGGALLSMITLGAVNHRKVRWSCAREKHVDDDPNS